VRSVNDLPTISDIIGQQIEEDTAPPPIPFTISDLETPPNSLLVTATSNNQALVPNANISLGGSGTDRTLRITPLPNRSGLATITVTVNDGEGGTAVDAFVLNVGKSNDDPTISAIADAVTNEDTPTAAIAFTVDDTETAPDAITVSGTSNNTLLVPNANIVTSGTGGSRTVRVTPAANQFGSALITVRADDGAGGTATSTFLVTVNSVNDAPVNSVPGTQVISEDDPLEFSDVHGNRISISDVDAGANNILVTLIVSKGALNANTAAGVTITGNGTGTVTLAGSTSNVNVALNGLLYTPLPNSHESDSLRIITNDQGNSGSGGIKTISNTVLIIVAAVNDDPRITSPDTVTILENSTSALTVTAADPDGDVPVFSIINGPDRSLFAIGAATGALRFLVAPDFENPADSNRDNIYQVEVRVEDGNGGMATQLISVTVTNVNETAPTVRILDVTPNPRAQAVADMSLVFSEAVTGFDVSDLSLTRSTDQTVSLLPGSATLTTVDNVLWRLHGLGELTAAAGIYELTISAAGSGIQDLQGTGLAQDQKVRWTNGAGDVDGDRDFDQFDLIALLQSDRYLTGQPATWSQGDWNGDGVFNQLDILMALQTQPTHYLQGPFGASRLAARPPRGRAISTPIETVPTDASSPTGNETASDQVFAAIGTGS
jgi:hypothetical protein